MAPAGSASVNFAAATAVLSKAIVLLIKIKQLLEIL